jgi:hypothetical protein
MRRFEVCKKVADQTEIDPPVICNEETLSLGKSLVN